MNDRVADRSRQSEWLGVRGAIPSPRPTEAEDDKQQAGRQKPGGHRVRDSGGHRPLLKQQQHLSPGRIGDRPEDVAHGFDI